MDQVHKFPHMGKFMHLIREANNLRSSFEQKDVAHAKKKKIDYIKS